MAAIHLRAMKNACGPEVPAEIGANVVQREYEGGGVVPVLQLWVGGDTVEIWPADADHIQTLGERLLKLAAQLR